MYSQIMLNQMFLKHNILLYLIVLLNILPQKLMLLPIIGQLRDGGMAPPASRVGVGVAQVLHHQRQDHHMEEELVVVHPHIMVEGGAIVLHDVQALTHIILAPTDRPNIEEEVNNGGHPHHHSREDMDQFLTLKGFS